MEIRNLDTVSLAEITHTFNAAFVDYKIRFNLTEDVMATKIKSENIQLQFSPGALDGDKLVGFILSATDTINNEKTVYNAGTGVLPDYRGRNISSKLYDHLIEQLKQYDYNKHLLEVFDDNEKAIAVYAGAGFRARRFMLCYQGSVPRVEEVSMVKEIPVDVELFQSFWDVKPSWQNGLPSILRNLNEHTIIGIEDKGQLIAYAIYIKQNGRIKQLAVKPDKRRQGFGAQLLNYIISDVGKELTVTCVEEHTAVDLFFKKMGLTPFINMFEMEFTVSKEAS